MNDINEVNFNVDYEAISKRFKEFASIGEVYYPLKTNSNVNILKFLINEYEDRPHGFLISHVSHFNKLVDLGVSPRSMCVINVLLEDETVKYLYDKGVRYFTFDNMKSLDSFLSYSDINGVRISVRLCISEVFNEFSHLGGDISECKLMLKKLNEVECKDFGISFYLQKEVVNNPNALDDMLKFIVNNFRGYNINFINIGGSKRPNEINLELINNIKIELGIDKIILEPGRYLIGEFIDMETRIIKTKKVMDNFVVVIKNGIYGGLLDSLLYHKRFDIRLKVNGEEIKLGYERVNESDSEVYICGASSDSGDRLGKYYIDNKYLEYLKKDNILVVKFAGAYVEEFFMSLGGDLIINYK